MMFLSKVAESTETKLRAARVSKRLPQVNQSSARETQKLERSVLWIDPCEIAAC